MMRRLRAASVVAAATCLPALAGANGRADDCPNPEPSVFTDHWVELFYDATYRRGPEGRIARGGAPGMERTAPSQIAFDRIVTLPLPEWELEGPITFQAVAEDANGVPYVRDVVIEEPVLMITNDFQAGDQGAAFNWESYRPLGRDLLQEFVATGPADDGGNIWFSAHGQASRFMDEQLGLSRDCFNPLEAGLPACERAVLNSIAAHGVPYSFNPPGVTYTDPGDPDACPIVDGTYDAFLSNLWWKERVLVFIADRSTFVRPSFNPTTGTAPGMADGRPGWDRSEASYRFPQASESPGWTGPSLDEVALATADFVGYSGDQVYRGWTGFQAWYSQWKVNSWGNATGDFPDESSRISCPYSTFPFSGLGLTAYWPATPATGPADFRSSFVGVSEFISKGEKPLYLVAIREHSAYYGAPDFTDGDGPPGQVSWCDACPGDYDMDGVIDGRDLALLLLNWGSTSLCYTIDKTDPVVNGNDLALLLANWNAECGWPLSEWRPPDCGDAPARP